MTDLFANVAEFIKQQKCEPGTVRGTDRIFAMPTDMPYAEREILAATARAVDPGIDVLRATREGHLVFAQPSADSGQHPFEQFPVQAMLRKLGDIKRAVSESMQPGNDGSLTFQQTNNLSLVELEYVVRAALPYPTPIAMDYDLPAGKTYDNYGVPASGRVSLEELCWLKECAEAEQNHDAVAELAALRASRIVVRPEDAALLQARLGMSEARVQKLTPSA
ncbi:MAG: hypothetical protein ACKVOE_06590 [Rickettsiales bacterium]